MIRVAIAGILGRMGSTLAAYVERDPGMTLAGGTTRPGTMPAELGNGHRPRHRIVDRIELLLDETDVLIDVSSAAASMNHALACVQARCPIVIGSKGIDPNHVAELQEYSTRIPVFYGPDFCIETAAVMSVLPRLLEIVPDVQVEVREFGIECDTNQQLSLEPVIPWQGDQAGQVILLAGEHQEIVLQQRIHSADAYAQGALRAIRHVAGKTSGFYTIENLIATGAYQ